MGYVVDSMGKVLVAHGLKLNCSRRVCEVTGGLLVNAGAVGHGALLRTGDIGLVGVLLLGRGQHLLRGAVSHQGWCPHWLAQLKRRGLGAEVGNLGLYRLIQVGHGIALAQRLRDVRN